MMRSISPMCQEHLSWLSRTRVRGRQTGRQVRPNPSLKRRRATAAALGRAAYFVYSPAHGQAAAPRVLARTLGSIQSTAPYIGEPHMLQLRPNCECCNRDLPPESEDALICSFECTFCCACATSVLKGVCPNCGGELVARPRRPAEKLAKSPASTERIFKPQGCANAA